MGRSILSLGIIFLAFFFTTVGCGEVHAGHWVWSADNKAYYQPDNDCGYNSPECRKECMDGGISHGQPWSEGHFARAVARAECKICPNRMAGCVTRSRCGLFTTIH